MIIPSPRRIASLLVSTCVVGGAILAALPLLGFDNWVLDNLTSGTVQLAAGLACLSLLALALRLRRVALLAAMMAVLPSARIYSSVGAGPERDTPVQARWLVANVLTSNRSHEALLELIRAHDPEVVGLVETDARWLEALDGPLRDYPHRVLHPREDNFGLALYSRLPLYGAKILDVGITPTITASIALGEREVDLVLVHVLPPISRRYSTHRDEQLARLGELRPREGHGLVIAGDFNATPYSPVFKDAFREPPFVRGGGLTGTFPATAPVWLRFPIDHALSAGAVSAHAIVARDIGSDHFPLLIELRVR